ncbi:MAG: hypothetical protein ACFFG0_00780 [Candidatus Thorarchaeota archaeon]
MENPCRECLVKSICVHACDDFLNFRRTFQLLNVDGWIKYYELRPRVLEWAKNNERSM